jgi:cellulose synthase/poly-beta-1,6-N-acetylglucosamine synthase-like glycosyltransferase
MPARGRAIARNAGLRVAVGEIVVFIDADCVPQAGWLEALVGGFDDPEVGCVAGEIVNEFTGGPLAEYMAANGHLSQADNFQHPFLPFAATGNVAFRRELLERIGGFDESLSEAEDADLCWRMQLETHYRIKLVPEAVVVHRMDVSPRGVFRQKRRHGLGAVMLYKKYRHDWKPPRKSVKTFYWEYRSLARRALRLGWRWWRGWVGIPERSALPFDENQIFFELGWKLGLVQGSLRHRVLFL